MKLKVRKIEDAGITTDTPITKSLKGITLKSALRLILKELEMTYVIRDEVLPRLARMGLRTLR